MAMWEKETCYPLLYLCGGIQKEIKEYRDTNYAALIVNQKKKNYAALINLIGGAR